MVTRVDSVRFLVGSRTLYGAGRGVSLQTALLNRSMKSYHKKKDHNETGQWWSDIHHALLRLNVDLC
jgi:hypothetical protein